MKLSMESYVERGKGDVQDKLQEGTRETVKIGEEFQEVKDQLKDIPGGLDDDLLAMIKDAENEGRDEAEQDVEETERTVIDEGKNNADTINNDVQTKISDNMEAKGKLEGIRSKYGRDSIGQAKDAIGQNTETGEDLLRILEDAINDANQDIQNVKDNL